MAKKTTSRLSADEARWRAASDYDTMKRYNEIQKDKKRIKAAQKYAEEELKNAQNAANMLKCGGKLNKK